MKKVVLHPGKRLDKILIDKGMSQRELASKIDIAHSVLNNILNGNRNLSVGIAFSLEALGMGKAETWLKEQMDYLIYIASEDEELRNKNDFIRLKSELEEFVPISYFKNQNISEIKSSEDIKEIFKIYNVKNIESLSKQVRSFKPKHFRKSSKFAEEPKNVFAWSVLAEYKAKKENVAPFDLANEKSLIDELKKCFYENVETISKTQEILNRYGIKFFILDRPPKTPVEGKSFMSGKNPAIVLSLKYKRLDNFAFTLMHEVAHVFTHLSKPKYKDESFYTRNVNTKEEKEADNYAKNKLIDNNSWNEFIYLNSYDFNAYVIEEFSKKIQVHPAIIKGRICFEYPEYYKKRILLSKPNVLPLYQE